MTFKEVPSQIDFAHNEEATLKFWQDKRIFEKSVAGLADQKAFTFYDGPPFATGLPHYGHLLASTIKDIVPRYWTMKGCKVERRWGWDCHGLPVEQEIDKKHQFKSAKDIEAFGIANYNRECRDIVLRFTAEWQKTINRLGRWVDFENDYKTMDKNFMESVWWVIGELWRKKLIYRGFKVMPFSTPLGTPLSNFEASSNYQDVQDPAITITLPLKATPDTAFLAWTTTPWTLPTNLALAVGADLDYVEVKNSDGKKYILAEALAPNFFKKGEYEVVRKMPGTELVGLEYEPLFSFFAEHKKPYFSIVTSPHVTVDSGTGIVHMAPAHGQEDFDACAQVGIDPICVVDAAGIFSASAGPYAGLFVKDADKKIIADLKAAGRLFKQDTLQHSYAFCPRTDTPLINRVVASWFVKVDAIKDQLIANNLSATHWVPSHLREGRFGKWLENARDWAISRNRYWGNPLPFWEAFEEPEDKREYICLADVKELETLTGQKFSDLHREHLDGLVITKNGKKFRRVPEVLDCWFESGSMPYAQRHFPFEPGDDANRAPSGFPADFIAEGLDQTRGWFYTLSVLGTALFGEIPFKNVIVNGMLLAEDGKKMSKRLKNYPDPTHILNTYGADALRLYMIQSPAVRADELRFSEAGVKEIVRRILLKWWNAYSFFVSYAVVDKWGWELWSGYEDPIPPAPLNKGGAAGGGILQISVEKNILDAWILSRLQSLLKKTADEMAGYHLYNVVPALLDFIEDLTNTYIRLNRKRFWGEGETADKSAAYDTLYTVLLTLTKVMAPFTPFMAETMYANLGSGSMRESVHLEAYPVANAQLIMPKLESSVALANRIILMVRNLREQKNIKVKIPLKRLTIIHRDASLLEQLKTLEVYLHDELNLRVVEYAQNESDFVELSAKANGAVLGKRLGKKFANVSKQIAGLDTTSLIAVEQGGSVTLDGEVLTQGDFLIYRKARAGHENVLSDSFITIDLDLTVDKDQVSEGTAREVVSRIQKLRKTAELKLDDRIHVEYAADGEIAAAIVVHQEYICAQTLALKLVPSQAPQGQASEVCDVEDKKLIIALRVSA